MPNKQYQRGVRLERYLVGLGRQHGWEATRTAGSHGFCDVLWWRMTGLGPVNQGFEQLQQEGWCPRPTVSDLPGDWMYAFWRYTSARNLDKQEVWAIPIADGYSQTILWQAKTRKNRRRK